MSFSSGSNFEGGYNLCLAWMPGMKNTYLLGVFDVLPTSHGGGYAFPGSCQHLRRKLVK